MRYAKFKPNGVEPVVLVRDDLKSMHYYRVLSNSRHFYPMKDTIIFFMSEGQGYTNVSEQSFGTYKLLEEATFEPIVNGVLTINIPG